MVYNSKAKTDLAKNLIKYRKEAGFSQQKIADILGIKRSTYGYYEIDVCPPLGIMKKLANMYNISIDQLIANCNDIALTPRPREEFLKVADAKQDILDTVISTPRKTAEETELLMLYRMLPPEEKERAKQFINELLEKIEKD